MTRVQKHLGEQLSKILIKENTDFTSVRGDLLADELVFVLEHTAFRLLPIHDTDEIDVQLLEVDEVRKYDSYTEMASLNEYYGLTFSEIWNCRNSRGYFDLCALGFKQLHPTVLILSEGTALKLFKVERVTV